MKHGVDIGWGYQNLWDAVARLAISRDQDLIRESCNHWSLSARNLVAVGLGIAAQQRIAPGAAPYTSWPSVRLRYRGGRPVVTVDSDRTPGARQEITGAGRRANDRSLKIGQDTPRHVTSRQVANSFHLNHRLIPPATHAA